MKTVGILDPPSERVGGNRVTTARWSEILRGLGCEVFEEESWSGRDCDVLVALHAHRSHPSIAEFHRRHSARPIVVAATGTDIYGDKPLSDAARESFRLATRIVVLQPLALDALPPESRSRARVIFQSVAAPRVRPPKADDAFVVCTIAHLRPVKDPLLPAIAASFLPASSRIRVELVGGALDESVAVEVAREARENPRFRWLGELPRPAALDALARAHLFVSSSLHEGGSNAVSEALAYDVPILATRIPGSVGILGDDYAGLFPPRDARALARLMERSEVDAHFLSALAAQCRARSAVTDPAREIESWRTLLEEIRA
jgi:putative glycosyltransferase (TIGR04348 family)